jgi:cobalt-precorrin 5A hydrolase
VPKVLFLGVGCRKGVSASHLAEEFARFCEERGIVPGSVAAAASIACKREEAGLLAFCEGQDLPLSFFTAQELGEAQGEFTASAFVRETVGVDNVCERSAVLASGGTLLEKKYAENGVSFALAMKAPALNWNWEATWESSGS